MSLGSNIKKRRFQLNLSQQELADRLGYKSRATIAKIESGENSISHAKIIKFAQALETTFEALTSGIDSPNYEAPLAVFEPSPPINSDEKKIRSIAIILAGGRSMRNHRNVPNQFIEILGKPVIIYSLEAYESHPSIDDIYIVCLKGWEDIVTAYAKQHKITKLRGLISGGASGVLSIKNAVDAIKDKYSENDIIIFQESTRPLVTTEMISRLLQSCMVNKSTTVCSSMRDNLLFTIGEYKLESISRDSTISVESPEAYTLSQILKVFDTAAKENHELIETCCTTLLYNLGFQINFIEGSINNIKIVRQEDIAIATSLLRMREY